MVAPLGSALVESLHDAKLFETPAVVKQSRLMAVATLGRCAVWQVRRQFLLRLPERSRRMGHPATRHREQHLRILQLRGRDRKQVTIDNHKIRQFAGHE